jgi:hypothetical protein
LNPDYRDMLSALSAEGADYLLVGAYALAVHGLPRATGNIDLWIRPAPDNAACVLAAVRRFGAPLADLTKPDLLTPGTVFEIGVAPARIDLLTSIDGIEFDEAWADRCIVEIEGQVPVVLRQHLTRNKKATGRPQDVADATRLESSDPD